MRHHQGRLENLRSVLFISRSTNLHTLQVYHFPLSSINIYYFFIVSHYFLYSHLSPFFICFVLSSLLSFSSSPLLLLISPMFVLGSNSKGFRELKYGISFSLESLLSVLLFRHDSFSFFFSVLFHFLSSLRID